MSVLWMISNILSNNLTLHSIHVNYIYLKYNSRLLKLKITWVFRIVNQTSFSDRFKSI